MPCILNIADTLAVKLLQEDKNLISLIILKSWIISYSLQLPEFKRNNLYHNSLKIVFNSYRDTPYLVTSLQT